MQVLAADGKPLRGDMVTRVTLRTDLTPIPSTVEVEAIQTEDTERALIEGQVVGVGAGADEYLLVKVGAEVSVGQVRNGRQVATIRAIGILNSCAAVGRRLQRSIIREGSTFADIYRSIGADIQVATDFSVPRFSCFIGMLPTPEIARVLQEESAAAIFADGKLHFRRLSELVSEKAAIEYPVDRTEAIRSDYLERHAVPFAFTTSPANAFLSSKREAARGLAYRPRADARVLNNISTSLIQRRKLREGLQPGFRAGMRIDIAGMPHIVITAAHVYSTPAAEGGGEEYTQLWLGEYLT